MTIKVYSFIVFLWNKTIIYDIIAMGDKNEKKIFIEFVINFFFNVL